MSVVFLHGFLGAPRIWDEFALVPEAKRPWLPGHGTSPFITGSTFDDALMHWVERARLFSSERKSWLVGYSLGARIALSMALRWPECVEGLVLVGVDPGLESDSERASRLTWDHEQATLAERRGLPDFVRSWELLPLFATQASLPQPILDRQRETRLGHTEAGIAWSLRTFGLGAMPSRWRDLSKLGMPVHLVTGKHDVKFGTVAERMVKMIPNANHRRLAGGHNVILEDPRQFAEAIREIVGQ